VDGEEESVDYPMAPGCAGWGDAAVIVPWETYRSYGDVRLLEEQWPSMKAWVDYAAKRAASHRHPSREAERPEPGPHEQYVWDSGFQWGEWLEPGEIDMMAIFFGDKGDVATAYLYYSSSLLAKTATVLGRDGDARHYQELADQVLAAWREEFIGAGGSLTPSTQANHVRALAFGLVPDDLVEQTTQSLVELIRAADTHLGTGFLATPYLLPELARQGQLDLAYELLLQRTPPSWLGMLEGGATTVWEFWDGIGDDGQVTGSLNHYSKGAVISFLHRNIAGIRLTPEDQPAYRTFTVQPEPGGGLTWARAELDCPYGRVASAWRIIDGVLHLDVTVPAGTTATVILPDGTRHVTGPGSHAFTGALSDLEVVR
jgi:alpha-L-rhamnosidase